MKEAINFLKHVYSESVPDVANLLVAEAEGDVEMVKSYLTGVRNYIDKLLMEIKDGKRFKQKHSRQREAIGN